MADVNEKTSCWITAAFTDKNGAAGSPLSITYRIDDVGSGESIVPTTSVTPPLSSVEIHVTPDQNRIIRDTAPREIRRVTIVATYGLDDQSVQQYDYNVINMSYIS